jgi:F-type H+-transporting ATPase subunit gamma
MAVSPRLIRRRLKSVASTKKITKAMEMVSAAKMRKAVTAVLASRPYSLAAWRTVERLAKATDTSLHPLLRREKGNGRELVVLFASDRGLCGPFVSQLIKAFLSFMKGRDVEATDVVTVGRRGQEAVVRRGFRLAAAFTDIEVAPRAADLRPIARIAVDGFSSGTYDRVWLCFTDYRSALSQSPVVRCLLPLAPIAGLGEVNGTADANPAAASDYIFEPSTTLVLESLLPRLVEAQVYQAVLESSASEQSSRMMAMRSATDAATEMIEDLTLTYNQARQAGITREIAEISSGKAALEG